MKNFMSILLILICGTMACSDSIYNKDNHGFIVMFKERIPDSDISATATWKYKYKIEDFSNSWGNSPGVQKGYFYLHTSANFSIEDTLVFTTPSLIRSVDSLQEQLVIAAASLREQLSIRQAELQRFEKLNKKNIKLQTELKSATTKNQKLTKFKNDLKKLVVVADSATP